MNNNMNNKMKLSEFKKYKVLNSQCYNRDCFIPFNGNGIKICRFYELGQCRSAYERRKNGH